MEKFFSSNDFLLVIPRHGLGDILYNCLCLRFLKDKNIVKNEIVFVPKYGVFIADLFKLNSVPLYSRMLNSRLGKNATLKNEFRYWSTLYKYRNNCAMSLINDLVDKTIFNAFNIRSFPSWNLGNYLKTHPSGLRGHINKLFDKSQNIRINPKHILQRSLLLLNQVTDCTLDELWYVNKNLYKCTQKNNWKYVIFPDAGDEARALDARKINNILNIIADNQNTVIYSNNKSIHEAIKSVAVDFYPSLESLCSTLDSCSSVICADSFGAHISGLVKPDKIIILYPNQIRYPLYWEWWGLPTKKAYHIWQNKIYQLNDNYESHNLALCKVPVLVKEISQKTS